MANPIKSKFSRNFAAIAVLLVTPMTPLAAQDGGERTISQEERIDNGLKSFGYVSGLSRGCVAAEQQTALEKDVLEIHASITRLLGIDRAFLFSAAFGYGTSVEVEQGNCADILREYETRSEKYRSAAQGG